jgi:hypothetical protein
MIPCGAATNHSPTRIQPTNPKDLSSELTETFLTLAANCNVLVDSAIALGCGFSVHMTEIRASPEREDWSMRVSLQDECIRVMLFPQD